jgi:hypothetical protein
MYFKQKRGVIMKKLEDIKSKAEERGYKFLIGNKTNSELHYVKNEIALILYPKMGGFSLNFYIDELVNLETIQCNSFMNDEYFKSIEKDFIRYINKLKI